MKYRKHRNLKLSEIGVGCYALSGAYGSVDVKRFQQMIHRAYELGVNFFDTAEAYGDAEKYLGQVVQSFREDIIIATKVGVREGIRPNLSKEYIFKACDRSLRQLQTDYIDLYQVHFDDPDTPVNETVETLEELVREGKIRYYGIGHLPLHRVMSYLKLGSPFSILMELSAVARASRDELLPLCEEYGIGAIAFSATGRGLLTGKIRPDAKFEPGDIRNFDPLFQREQFQSGLRIKDKFRELANQYGKTPVQVAIAWVLAQPSIICALTGSSKIKHLEENIGGSGWALSRRNLASLEDFFNEENQWLQKQQRTALKRILSEALPKDPNQAFVDLIYVMETSHALGLLTEKEVRPVLQQLWEVKDKLNQSSRLKLQQVQKKLMATIHLDND